MVDDNLPMDRMVHHTVMDYGVMDNAVMDHPMRRYMMHRVMDHMMRGIGLGQHGRRGKGRGQGEAGGGYQSFHRKPPVGKLGLDCDFLPELTVFARTCGRLSFKSKGLATLGGRTRAYSSMVRAEDS